MGRLTNREGAALLREQIQNAERCDVLARDIVRHLNDIHSINPPVDMEIERLLLEDERLALENDTSHLKFTNGLVTFSPSGASKCKRELFYKACQLQGDPKTFYPFQRRQMRNGSAVHAATQKDLLYAEKYLEKPNFEVVRTKAGRPAWEKNIRQVKQFEHRGVRFQIYGMMDGVLKYTPDATKLGLEFKTKSTTISSIGDYKMRDAQESHKQQCIAYSLIFNLREFLIVYESLAKDSWTKNENAKPDLRAFCVEVSDNQREALLDKYAEVAEARYNGEILPAEFDKCIFCTYKTQCEEMAS
ncbi:hypothetical protein SAMN05660649_04341 [Desulfotomaculum arcticum]|uniref:PD-(D/E)XK nuclease superfamily protein n=1 Tax=Desulfotruncus arcticus DSM 17038 TaxID=1121424 RepID=A0A1I2YA56_9FIRM|nr:PD-(D/E)XK nuclease family protein [Desulfotruncus arcticus]SFH22553.1 hypothetical protein SAMN05660649_04341 [Desulfotomaculum arcticum] [Desulfotruncus arcticus DSM 17038]